MAFRHVLCLYLALALAWCEEALSFSSSSRGTISALPSMSTKDSSGMGMMRSQLPFMESPTSIVATTSIGPRRLQHTHMSMASDDSSSDQEATTKKEQGKGASNSKNTKNAILMVPLFCKFIVVILIKFLTDLVVYPTLFLYRLARRATRTVVGWFGKIRFGASPSSFKPNGE